jgi:DNA-binding winged helix-turn-helix (wHTH) protein/TolB-like protein
MAMPCATHTGRAKRQERLAGSRRSRAEVRESIVFMNVFSSPVPAHNAPAAGVATLVAEGRAATMDRRNHAEALPMALRREPEEVAEVDVEIAALRFDGFTFDLQRSELSRDADGTVVALRPKAEALLRTFLAHPRRLLGRDDLIGTVWPHAVVTDDSLVHCVGELRLALGDREQRLIRTVPRRGYVLEAAVEALRRVPLVPAARSPLEVTSRPAPAESAPQALPLHAPAPRRWRARQLAAVVVICSAAAGVALAWQATRPKAHIDAMIAARSALAVMPFAVGEGVARRALGDEIADAITNQLATRIGVRGIGRAATSAYGPSPSLDRLAAELKATHVVGGRVTPSNIAGRVTIDAQILHIARGQVVWTRQFPDLDVEAPDTFQEIGQHVANGLRNHANRSDDARPDVFDETDPAELTLRGWRDLDRRKSMDDVYRARGRFQAALRQDADSVIALNGLAATYSVERSDPARRLTAAQLATHRDIVDRARRLAPEDSTALMLWGQLQIMEGRADLALPAFEKASRLVPSYPMAHILVAQSLLLAGRLDEVQAHADRAIARGAGDARRESGAYAIAAEAALMRGDDEGARGLARHAIASLPDNLSAHATLAAVEALAGRDDLAAIEVKAVLRLWPGATVAHLDDLRPSRHPLYLERRARLYEGLRLAGLPPGS